MVLKFAEDDIEVVKKSHPKYNTGVITENSTAKMKEINPRMKRIVQIKYKRYLQENLSQNVMRRVPMIPRTPKPIKTPKNLFLKFNTWEVRQRRHSATITSAFSPTPTPLGFMEAA